MTISLAIAPHLPYLRRFARAVSGSQSSGDAYAVATLEAIVADSGVFRADLEPRVALYQVFLGVWGSVSLTTDLASGEPAHSSLTTPQAVGSKRLGALTPPSRVAFVLSAVEGFSEQQIADALGCSVDDAKALIHRAGLEISRQIATDVLIIEDEPMIAMNIEALVEDLGHRVTEVARTHREAVAAVKRQKPGLILADVQLADDSSGDQRGSGNSWSAQRSHRLYHGLSGTVLDRRASRTGVSDFEALSGRYGQSRHQPGAVFRSEGLIAARHGSRRRQASLGWLKERRCFAPRRVASNLTDATESMRKSHGSGQVGI